MTKPHPLLLLLPVTAGITACTGSDGVDPQSDSNRSFEPTVTLSRGALDCNYGANPPQLDPPLSGSDEYGLRLAGQPTSPQTYIEFDFLPVLPLDLPQPVSLSAFGPVTISVSNAGTSVYAYGQTGNLPGNDGNEFFWVQGTNANELDPSPLTSASLEIEDMPTLDGGDGAFRIRMQFTDGGVYDVVVRAPMITNCEISSG